MSFARPAISPSVLEYLNAENGAHPQNAGARSVDAAEFGVCADGRDCSPGVRAALEHCRAIGARRLSFPKGRYQFKPEFAAEQYLFMSNNDAGLRRIAFHVRDFSNLEIDGQGSEFIFHGLIVPFVIEQSSQVFVRNVTLDWDVPFHCEGTVLSCDGTSMEMEIPAPFPYEVVNDRFRSLGAGADGWTLRHLLEFDPVRQETAYGAVDNYKAEDRFRVEEAGPNRVRFFGKFSSPWPRPGNVMLLADSRRMCPAFFITDTEGVTLSAVTIFHAGAMGVIAQKSADLRLLRVDVKPRPGGDRVISAVADATHFVSCRGRIELSDCNFQTQVDDATNVHGIYTKVIRGPDARRVIVRLVHRQQAGTNPIASGHRLQFVCRETLAPLYEANVVTVNRLNDEYTELGFADAVPESVQDDDAVLDLFWQPTETIIRRCTVSGNRARGFLLSVSGRVLIEDCKFHTPGAAILIEGDANYWFEAGPVGDVTIRANEFNSCNFGPWGHAAIQISPGIETAFHREPRYHRDVLIENNTFKVFFPTLLAVQAIDGLRFRENQVTQSDAYPPKEPDAPPFWIQNSSNVQIAG